MRSDSIEINLSLRKIEELIELFPDPTLLLDKRGSIIAFNSLFTEFCTKISHAFKEFQSTEQILQIFGKNQKALVDLALNPHQQIEIPNLLINQSQNSYSLELYLPNIEQGLYIRLQASSIRENNQIIGLIENFRDITDQIKAEEMLAENEEKYSLLFQQSEEGIVLADLEGKIIDINSSALKLFGYTKKEILKLEIQKIPAFSEYFQSYLVDSNPRPFAISIKNRKGESFFIEISINDCILHGQKIYQIIVRDITEQQKLEEERARADKLESIGLLAGGIAHDFNNILTGILGNLDLLKCEALNLAQEEFVNDIRNGVHRAIDLTKQLLTFSKGGKPIKRLENIQEIILSSEKLVMRGTKSKCEITIENNLPLVNVDKGQISQVINNLLINASQSMPQGGIIFIRVNRIHFTTTINTVPAGDYVLIEIQDQGVGIPKKYYNKIFTPYFTTKAGGNGLGLATCYSILRQHGGFIRFESEINRGTTFLVYLPESKEKVQEITPNKALQTLHTFKELYILLMDDEETVLQVLSKMLSLLGCICEKAHNGHDAIEKYCAKFSTNTRYDIVIMDLTIPGGMGGKETLEKLKEIDPDIKAVVSSGYSDDVVLAEYHKYGFIDLLHKPFTLEDIQAILLKHLSHKLIK